MKRHPSLHPLSEHHHHALIQSLTRASDCNRNDQVAPAVILWPDRERQREPVLPVLRERFLPRTVTLLHPVGDGRELIESLAPFVKRQDPIQGQATAYVCENYVCNLPTADLAQFARLLDRTPP